MTALVLHAALSLLAWLLAPWLLLFDLFAPVRRVEVT